MRRSLVRFVVASVLIVGSPFALTASAARYAFGRSGDVGYDGNGEVREQNGSALSETGLGVTLADIGVTGPDDDVIVRMTLNEDDNAARLIRINLLLTLPDDASLAARCATYALGGVCGSMWSSNVTANLETYPAEALDPDGDGEIDSDGDGTLDAEENYQNNVVSSFQLFFQPAGQLFTNAPVDFTLDGALLQTLLSGIGASNLYIGLSVSFVNCTAPDDDAFGCIPGEIEAKQKSATIDVLSADGTDPTTPVPEPTTLALIGAGLGAMALRRRRT